MGTKITFSNMTGAYTSNAALNSLFDLIEAEFDKCLYTDGTAPNSMTADFDLNSNDLLNGGTLNATDIVIGGTSLAAQVTAAAASAAAALTSENNAATSETNAAASYDAFDDRYLGAKASDPTLDNDGDALLAGALYFNTTTNTMKAYTGSAWGDISVPTNFLALTDTPSSLSGQALNYVRVNAGETALEFTASAATVGDADYGDITVSGSGTVWTIDDGIAVSNWNLTTPTITTSVTFGGSTLTGLTGADLTFATGTAGTSGNLAMWNADGDLVDSTYAPIDEDSMATNSATRLPSQQSVKAYVDAQVATVSDTFGTQLLHMQDQQTAGTNGGTFTSGAWRTRTLNTEVTDELTVTLTSNQFALADGTYWIEAEVPASDVANHRARLYNATDAATAVLGSSARANTQADNAPSFIRGRFTVSGGPKTFEIQDICGTTKATTGFGVASNLDSQTEIYTDVRIWKIA